MPTPSRVRAVLLPMAYEFDVPVVVIRPIDLADGNARQSFTQFVNKAADNLRA